MTGPAPQTQPNWDWRAAGNFIGGGAGSGLLILGGIGALYAPIPLVLVTGLALGLVAIGLTLVWLEIGRPWRFMHVFFNPQTSWMTREALVAVPLFVMGGLAAWFNDPWLCLGAGGVGFGFLYCQSRILTAAKGIPAWRDLSVVPLIMITGVTEGAGLLLAVILQAPGNGRWFLILFLFLLVVRLAAWLGYRWRLEAVGAPAETLKCLTDISRWFVPLGFALPVIGASTLLVIEPHALWTALGSGVLAVAGGWLLKYRLVTEAAYTQGFAVPLSPVRGQGSAGPGARPGWK